MSLLQQAELERQLQRRDARILELEEALDSEKQNEELFIQPCQGCKTPGKCKTTEFCDTACRILPTYYVRDISGNYHEARAWEAAHGIKGRL